VSFVFIFKGAKKTSGSFT